MIGFGFIPPIDPITKYGMQVLGVFIGCVYAWMIGQYIWPSVLALVILGFFGSNTVVGMLGSAYGHQVPIMILWALIFCHVMISSGMLEVVTNKILSNKLVTKGPWILCFFLCVASAVATAFVTISTPVTLFLWFIFYGIMEKLNIPKFSPYSSAVLILIALTSYTGSVIFPFNPSTQIVVGVMGAFIDVNTINWMGYILFWIIFNVVYIPLVILFFKYILRIKAPFDTIDDTIIKIEKKPLTATQKAVLAYLTLLIICMVLPSFLPAENIIKIFLARLGTNGLFVVINVLLAITFIKEKSLQDIEEALKNSVPWNIYFLVATALTISPLLTSEDTGIGILLNTAVGSLVEGKSELAFTIIILLLGLIVTNCINNGVCITLLVPITYTFSQLIGANFMGICVMFCGILLMGVVLPSGSGQGALLHGNGDYLKSSAIYKYTILALIPFILVFYIVGIPLSNMLF